MNITLMAHDKKKELMVQFCTAYKSILSKHSLSATAATGRLVSEATGLPVIGAISQVATPAAKQIAQRRNRLFAGSLAALGGLYALLLVVDMIQRSGVA